MNELSRAREKASEFGLYDPAYEHDACGLGFVASVKGLPSHEIVQQGLQILKNLDHRGAVGADPLCGDGAGIMVQIPDEFFRAEMAKRFRRPAITASAWCSCRVNTRQDAHANRSLKERLKPKARFFSAGAMFL